MLKWSNSSPRQSRGISQRIRRPRRRQSHKHRSDTFENRTAKFLILCPPAFGRPLPARTPAFPEEKAKNTQHCGACPGFFWSSHVFCNMDFYDRWPKTKQLYAQPVRLLLGHCDNRHNQTGVKSRVNLPGCPGCYREKNKRTLVGSLPSVWVPFNPSEQHLLRRRWEWILTLTFPPLERAPGGAIGIPPA